MRYQRDGLVMSRDLSGTVRTSRRCSTSSLVPKPRENGSSLKSQVYWVTFVHTTNAPKQIDLAASQSTCGFHRAATSDLLNSTFGNLMDSFTSERQEVEKRSQRLRSLAVCKGGSLKRRAWCRRNGRRIKCLPKVRVINNTRDNTKKKMSVS